MYEREPAKLDIGLRDNALEMYRLLVEKYQVSNPRDLPFQEDDVIHAVNTLIEWKAQMSDTNPAGQSLLEYDLDTHTFFVDAGFHDPRHVSEVIYSLVNVQAKAEASGLIFFAHRVQMKIKELLPLSGNY